MCFVRNLVTVVGSHVFASDRKQREPVSWVLMFTVYHAGINTPSLAFKANILTMNCGGKEKVLFLLLLWKWIGGGNTSQFSATE